MFLSLNKQRLEPSDSLFDSFVMTTTAFLLIGGGKFIWIKISADKCTYSPAKGDEPDWFHADHKPRTRDVRAMSRVASATCPPP